MQIKNLQNKVIKNKYKIYYCIKVRICNIVYTICYTVVR